MPDNELDAAIAKFLAQQINGRQGLHLSELMSGYELAARAEGKSSATVDVVRAAVRYLGEFLEKNSLSTAISDIGITEIRRYIVDLQDRGKFAKHRFTKPQGGNLSGHTVNAYLRSLQSFFSWLSNEGLINDNPFTKLKIPKPPHKVIPVFTEAQLQCLFACIDVSAALGHRDFTMILTLLDTGIRCSELTGIKMEDVQLDSRYIKVHGKGNQERIVPIGAKVIKAIWKYIQVYRPEPIKPRCSNLFLTRNGRPITRYRLETIVSKYGHRASLTGVRCSPHTFRHTFCVTFLRNGGDVFTLQRITGHSQLETLRGYINLAMADIQEVHRLNSPADNLEFKLNRGPKHP